MPLLHTEQATKKQLVKMLKAQGFVVEAVYSAVFRWKAKYRLFRAVFWCLHQVAVRTNGRIYVPWLTDAATESYTFVVKKAPVIVELYGLSGAGKSALGRELAAADPMVKLVRPQKKTMHLVYFIVRNPVTFGFWMYQMMKYAVVYGDIKLLRHRVSILLSTFAAFAAAQREQAGIVVLDEGLFQRIFSIYEQKRSAEELLSLVRSIPQVRMVVVVNRNDGHFLRYQPGADNPRARMGEAYMTAWKDIILHNHASLQAALKQLSFPTFSMTADHTTGQLLTKLKTL